MQEQARARGGDDLEQEGLLRQDEKATGGGRQVGLEALGVCIFGESAISERSDFRPRMHL